MIFKKSSFIEYVGLTIVLLSSVVFAWLGLGPCDRHQFASMSFAGLSWFACFGRLESEANGFLYYLALGLFSDIFGWSHITAAAFSILSLVGSAFLLYLTVGRLWGGRAALYSAFFLVGFNGSVFFSSYIRFYAFNMLFVSLTAFFTVLWLEKKRARRDGCCSKERQSEISSIDSGLLWLSLLLALSLVGAMGTMIVSAAVSLAVFISVLADNRQDKQSWLYVGSLVCLLAVLLLLLIKFNPQAYALQGKNMAPSLLLLGKVFAKYLGLEAVAGRLPLSVAFWETSLDLWFIPALMSAGLLTVGFTECWQKRRLLFITWSLLPLLLLVYSFVFKPLISIWNLSFVIPVLAVLMGVGLAKLKVKWQYLFLLVWAFLAQIALINFSWPADTDYAKAWKIRSQYKRAPLLLADFQVLERAESSLEPYFSQPSFTLDNSRRLLIPVKQYKSEADFWLDKNAFNAHFGRPVHDGTELSNVPWRLLSGVSLLSWQLFPYKVQGAPLRQLLTKPPENIDHLASSLSLQARPWLPDRRNLRNNKNWQFLTSAPSYAKGAPKALFILYTSPWCASEVEPFSLEKMADFLPAWRKAVVWDCGGVQLALVSFR